MAKYRFRNTAKEDLIAIHQYDMVKFGQDQAGKYLHYFFEHFAVVAQRPLVFESGDFTKLGYGTSVFGADSIFWRIENEIAEIMAIISGQNINQIPNSIMTANFEYN